VIQSYTFQEATNAQRLPMRMQKHVIKSKCPSVPHKTNITARLTQTDRTQHGNQVQQGDIFSNE